MSVNSFNNYISTLLDNNELYDFSNKKKCSNAHILYMLNRTQSMFTWEGLPETIPQRILELYLQTNGNVCFYKYRGELYVFTGGFGGKPDVYYMPTVYTISNPALNISKSLEIGKECVIIPNDCMYIGLLPLFRRYATMLSENELSLKIADINTRIISLISAPDDRTYKSGEKYLSDIEEGKQGIISENGFLDGIKVQPYANTSNSNALTNLIEVEQYLKASWFNEIGLNANYNMKRESINAGETQLNNDALLPLVDNMLNSREKGIEEVNAMFGTNISVKLSSSWEDNIQEIDFEHEGGNTENAQSEDRPIE